MIRTKSIILLSVIAFFGYQPLMAADYSCFIKIGDGEISSTCQDPITIVNQDEANGRAIVQADMRSMDNWKCLKTVAVIRKPAGWVGNSPTNNGYGGDGGTFSNDSEMQIVIPSGAKSGVLSLYHNDYSAGPYPMMIIDDMTSQISILELSFGDQHFQMEDICLHNTRGYDRHNRENETSRISKNWNRKNHCRESKNVTLFSEFIYRLGGNDNEAGRNDYRYWIGINTVATSLHGSRVGSGIKIMILTVSTEACRR